LKKADFTGADLRDASFKSARLECALFDGADCRRARFSRAVLDGARFVSSNLEGAKCKESSWRQAILREARLQHATMWGCQMESITLSDAKLQQADLSGSNLQGAFMSGAKMRGVQASGCDLSGANLQKAVLYGADLKLADLSFAKLQGADLRKAQVMGVNTWNVACDGRTQQHGLRFETWVESGQDRYDVTFDNLEMTYLISLFLQNPKMEHIFNASTSKIVLILGRFSGRSFGVVKALRAELPKHDRVPVVFDFDLPKERDTVEVVSTLAGLSRIVICDLTRPKSAPLEVHAIVPHLSIPFAPIIERGAEEFSMLEAMKKYPWVMPTIQYRSKKQLIDNLDTVILEPAEKKRRQLDRARLRARSSAKPIPIEKLVEPE
jgi:uncharacterized protein YjbI with pentapeptide repeats